MLQQQRQPPPCTSSKWMTMKSKPSCRLHGQQLMVIILMELKTGMALQVPSCT
uniref:Alternative protein ZFX n=1 Tax=Homo sapiens TaxID=9606 RepID=L8E7U7_HUMAN|nr:alternative protein ZFX [Homo sapiens]